MSKSISQIRLFAPLGCALSLAVSNAAAEQPKSLEVQKTEYENSFKLSWDSAEGKTYFLQQSTALDGWNYFPLVIRGIGGQDWMGVSSTDDKGFFRYVESPVPTNDLLSADHDGDGVPSFAELTVSNTDPLKFSTIGDGVSDRVLFPNPVSGIFTDNSNGIQYLILPNSPGSVSPPQIVATHYFEAPDYVIESIKGEMTLPKVGYPEFPSTVSPNPNTRYLKFSRQMEITPIGGTGYLPRPWVYGYTWNSSLPIHRVTLFSGFDYTISRINPLTGVESTSPPPPGNSGYFRNYFEGPLPNTPDWSLPHWRGTFISYNQNNNFYEREPINGGWDGTSYPTYHEILAEKNDAAKLLQTAQGNRPPYPLSWIEGNPWAFWDIWNNELGVSYSRTKFRIKNKNGITDGEPAQVFVFFDPEGGEREEVMHVEWNGQGAYSPEYEIDPAALRPGVQGTFHINAGSMFFEINLTQTDARKNGQTVIIPMQGSAISTRSLAAVNAYPPSPVPSDTATPSAVKFPGMDDSWYDGATITLAKVSGEGAITFRAVDPQTGIETDIPTGQNLAPDFFSSRGEHSGSEWIVAGTDVGKVTMKLTYEKGDTKLSIDRTAIIIPSIKVAPSHAPLAGLSRAKITLGNLGNTQMPVLPVGQMPVIHIGGVAATEVRQDEFEPRTFYFSPPPIPAAGLKTLAVSAFSIGGAEFTAHSALYPSEGIEYSDSLEPGLAGISDSIGVSIGEFLSSALTAKAEGSSNDAAFDHLTSEMDSLTGEQLSRIKQHVNGKVFTPATSHLFDTMVSENNIALESAGFAIYGFHVPAPPVPVAASSTPQLGEGNFFADARQWMDDNGARSFKGSYKNYAHFAVVEASEFDLTAWTTTTTNKNIYSAMAANPGAKIIINGALFNYRNETFVTTGLVFSNGVKLPTSTDPSKASHGVANQRYWFGQTTDNSMAANGATAASFQFGGKGHPPVPAVPPGPADIHSSTGGMISCIWPDAAGIRQKVTPVMDSDLKTYAAMGKGAMLGYGIIGIDRATGLMIILSKENGYTTRLNIFDVQNALWNSGVDQAVATDGGSSVALAVDGVVKNKGPRHYGNIGARETVTSYLVFTPIPVAKLSSPEPGATVQKNASVLVSATAKGGTGNITKIEFFQAGVKIGEDTTAPYSITHTQNTAGTFLLFAKVFDSDGASAESVKTSITVNP